MVWTVEGKNRLSTAIKRFSAIEPRKYLKVVAVKTAREFGGTVSKAATIFSAFFQK